MMSFIIRKAKARELSSLLPIYQSVFTKHHIFQQSAKDIAGYLRETHATSGRQDGGYLIPEKWGLYPAALLRLSIPISGSTNPQ